jgi:hypothetical protein
VAAPAAAAVPGYRFTVGRNQLYAYSLDQAVTWESAGDRLEYHTKLTWKFLLAVTEATAGRAVLEITILRVQATHDGPGSRRLVDSGRPEGQDGSDDPLIGHLLALNGAVLTVVVDPATGRVAEVRGGEAIVARINQRAPAPFAGDPPPLEAQAKASFGSEALARLWSQLLALPTTMPERVPLGPPLGGEVERTWQANGAYVLAFPGGVDRLSVKLVPDPTPVETTLSELGGSGRIAQNDGLPGESKGEVLFTLTFNALTQPVAQRHRLQWRLDPLIPR